MNFKLINLGSNVKGSNSNQLLPQQAELLQKGEIRILRSSNIAFMKTYNVVIFYQSAYVNISDISNILMIDKDRLKDVMESFDGKYSVNLTKDIFQSPETHVFQAALRTQWLENYEPFNSSITDILIYSITNSANASIIECIINSYKDKINWGNIDAYGNSIFHIALLQKDLNDQLLIQLFQTNDTLLKEHIHHLNNSNETLLSLAFKRYSTEPQLIIKALLDAGATIFVKKESVFRLPEIEISIGSYDNQVSIVVKRTFNGRHILSQLDNPFELVYITKEFHYFKPYDLNRVEHWNSLLQILNFPCPSLLHLLLREKTLPIKDYLACGSSLLHLAAEFGHASMLCEVLSLTNLNIGQREQKTENNALHKAILGKRCDNLKILLTHNDPKIVTYLKTRNNKNLTPLELAVHNAFHAGISIIFENSIDVLSEQWLHNVIIAIEDHKIDLLKVFLSFFSSPISNNTLLYEKTNSEGHSILHIAVRHFNEEIFELVLQKYLNCGVSSNQGANLIDCRVKNPLVAEFPGDTPLILSLKQRKFSATEKLLKAGASDLIRGNLCYFRCLVECCDEETILDQLLKIELKPNQFPINQEEMYQIWQVLDEEGNTLLHYSIKCNNHIAVKLLGALTPFSYYSQLDCEGNSILHTAARLNCSNEVTSEFIIALRIHKSNSGYTKLIDLQNHINGYSALMVAASVGKSTIFNFLIEEKASLILFDRKEDSILHIIVQYGNIDFFNIIMNVIDSSKDSDLQRLFYKPNSKGISPIEKAVLNARIEIIRSFRQVHNINFTNNVRGLSLLHLTVMIIKIDFATRQELIKELLTENYLLESMDKEGRTPTFLAILEQNVDSLKILLTFNPNILVIDKEGFTMLQRAIQLNNKEILISLISNIRSRGNCQEIVNFKGKNGKDALSYAIELFNYETIEKLLELEPFLQSNDNEGNSYIHIACKSPRSVNILKLLIKHFQTQEIGDLFVQKNSNLFTPLLYSIYHKNIEACQVLEEHNSKLFYLNEKGVQQFHATIGTSKLTFLEHSRVYYVGYTFSESKKLHLALATLTNLSETRIKSNTTVQLIQKLNNTLIQATVTHPSSQLLRILLDQLKSSSIAFNPIYELYIPAAKKGSLPVIDYLISEQISQEDYLKTEKSSILYEAINNPCDEVLIRFCERVSTLQNVDFKRVGEILICNQTTHPLILCLKLNKPKIFAFLLTENFQIPLTFIDQQGSTIIHAILWNTNRKEFLRIFIDLVKSRGSNISINKPLVDCSSRNSKETPLHICAQRFTDCLSMILELDPDPTLPDESGNTALHMAVKAKSTVRTKCIAEAFKNSECVINAINSKQQTPLHIAVIGISEEIVKVLLGYGANIYSIDQEKKTVLHHSVIITNRDKSLSMIKIFLEHEKQSPKPGRNILLESDFQGMNALHLAIKCLNIKATEYLLQQKPDISDIDHNNNTVFHLAVESKSSAILNLVLRANGLMENVKTSPSYHILNKENSEGNTALSLAIRAGNQNATELILSLQPQLNVSNNEGNSLLHLAVQSRSEDIIKELLRVMKVMNQKSIHDFLNAVNNEGLSPLHYAIALNNHNAARILCDDGAQLAINKSDGTITLCNGKSGLKLTLIVEHTTKWLRAGLYKYFVCYTISDEGKAYSITCLLPELSTTEFTDSTKLVEMSSMSEDAMQIITQCQCIEPLVTAINNKLIGLSKENSRKLLYSVLGKASIQVTEYLYANYPDQMNTTESLKMLKGAVGTDNNSNKIKDCLKRFPPLEDLHSSQHNKNIDLQEVNNIIKESLKISLSNSSTINLKTLLGYKVQINYSYGDNDDHTTLLHIILQLGSGLEFFSCILEEIETREQEKCRSTFINGTPLIECQNKAGKTVLHLCIEKGNKAMLEKLFLYVPNISIKDKSLNSIVHLVASFGNDLIAQFIFDKIHQSENDYFFKSFNADGCSSLHLAASAGRKQICSMLLSRGTPLYSTDEQHQTVLHHSLKVDSKMLRCATLSFLLCKHSDTMGIKNFLRLQDKDGSTALHVAVYLQYEEEVDLLIKADPSAIEICDNSSQTPLHLAIAPKLSIRKESIFSKVFAILNPESLNLDMHLIQERIICKQDDKGRTALHLSIQRQDKYALDLILSTQPCLDLTDNEGNTIFHEAVRCPSDNKSLSTVIKHIKVNFPHDLQNYLDLKNSNGIPPLHYSIVNQHHEAAKLLTQEKASLYFKNSSGNITLCDNIENLQLTFLLDTKTIKSETDSTYYIGYPIQREGESRWIITDLPKLSMTTFTDPQCILERIECKDKFEEKSLLNAILKCHSSEPLASAFRRNFLHTSRKIRNKCLTEIVGKTASPEVMRYYIIQFNGTVYQQVENCPSILESTVCNPDIVTFCVVIQALPIDLNQLTESHRDQLSQCLRDTIKRSLDTSDTSALDQLLRYQPSYTLCLTYTYGEDSETLLHFVVNKKEKIEYAECILKVACEIKLTAVSKDKKEVQFINFQDSKQRTVLHLSVLTNKEKMLTMLLEYKPDLTSCDINEDTALHLAVNCCRSQSLVNTILRAINSCVNPNEYLEARNKDGLTPLLLSITNSNAQIVQILFDNKANFYAIDTNNSTILHRVIKVQTPAIREAMMNTVLEHEKETLKLEKHLITSLQDLSGSTPLHIAVIRKQFESVKTLIAADPNVISICDNELQSVLHLAVLSQHNEIFNFILKNIQDQLENSTCIFDKHILCFQDINGKTPLHLTVKNQNTHAFEQLLLCNVCLDVVDKNQETVLHTAVRISDTKCEIMKNIVRELKEHHPEESFYQLNIEGYPPLQLAIELKKYQAAIELVDNSIGLCFQDEHNNRILACKCSNLNLQFLYERPKSSEETSDFWIGYLVEVGRKKNWIAAHLPDLEHTKYFKHDCGMQISEEMNGHLLRAILICHSSDPFNAAVKLGLIQQNNIGLVQQVGKHSTKEVMEHFIGWFKHEIYEQIGCNSSLLESAVANQDISVLHFLLEKLSDQSIIPPTEETEDKEMISMCLKNSLKLCLQSSTVNSLKEFLKYKARIDHTYENGNTLLHLAIELSVKFDIFEEIVKYSQGNSEIINAVNGQLCTPLHFAVYKGENCVTTLLLKSNANIYSQDSEKATILHHALRIVDEGKRISIIDLVIRFESKNFPCCKLYSIQDSESQTPLHLAVMNSDLEVVNRLLKFPSVLSTKNCRHQTPVHLAVIRKDLEIFNAVFTALKLLEKWPNNVIPYIDSIANFRDIEGKTPLLLSIENENDHAFKELLAAQILLNTVDELGHTVLHYAVRKNCPTNFLNDLIPIVNVSMLTQQNNKDLPPLQYAIKQRNNSAVHALINAGVKLVFEDRNKEITLCHSKDEMSLKIYKHKQNTFELWTGFDFEVGQSLYFVLSELSGLSNTILCNTRVTTPKELKSKNLKKVALCQCPEPLIAAFSIYDLDLKKDLTDGSDITETVAKYAPPNSIKCILKKDSSTLIEGRSGHLSMVESAVSNPNLESLIFLLNAISADFPKQKSRAPTVTNFEEAKFKCLTSSLKLSLNNDNPNALEILLKYQTPLGLFYEESDTLLHLIVKTDKSSEFIKKLFRCIINQANYQNNSTNTGICQYIDLRNDCRKLTALHVSMENGQEENVKTLLLYNPDVFLQDKLGNTSLHFAAKQRRIEFVKYIVKATRKSSLQQLLDSVNSEQETPLHVSVKSGNKDVAEYLVTSGAIYSLKSSHGYCILHHAVEFMHENERIQLIEFILEYEKQFTVSNLSLTAYRDDIGFTPLICAIQMRRLDAVKKLISYDQTLRICDNAGKTPLHYAVLSLKNDIFDTVLNAITEKEDAITKKKTTGENTDLDMDWIDHRVVCYRDNKGKTPLHLSIEKHNSHALDKLLLCRPCLDLVDSEGCTLLHCAVKFDFLDGLRTLLRELKLRFSDDYSYFVNLSNANQLPPLHYAIKESNVGCIEVLLEHEVTLAFADAGDITLADGLDGLSLSFIEYQQNGHQYWTGYSCTSDKKLFRVISRLPNLDKSILVQNSTDFSLLKKINIDCLQAISESKSFEPLNAAIKTNVLMLDTNLGDVLPIKLISQHGTRQSLRCLLKYMQPNLFTSYNGISSIIENAVNNTDGDAFEFLLENLPEFHDEPIPICDKNENLSENVLICLCFKNSFELSISNSTPNALVSLLKYFPKLNYRYGEKNNTLLHLMIYHEKSSDFIHCFLTVIKELHLEFITAENSPVTELQNSVGQTMVHLCIQMGQWENLEVLLKHGPNLHIKDTNNETSLHYAVITDKLDYVKKILEMVNDKQMLLSARNTSDLTALHIAIKKGNNDIVEFLLKSKSPFYPEKENETTILHLAVEIEDSETRVTIIKTIFLHEPKIHSASQRITCLKDGDGYSPLHLAVVKRYCNAVDYLLDIDLNSLFIKDKNEQTPLHLSTIPQGMGAQKYPDFSTEDHYIFTIVLKACIKLDGEHKHINVCGAKHLICIQDNRKRTAVHYVLEHMNIQALKELLETGSCLDIQDEDGHISTHEAVDNPNDIRCLKMLIDELKQRYGGSLFAPFNFH